MKNSMIRHSVSGVLAAAMVFSACSCGEKKSEDKNSNGGDSSQTVQTANEVIKNSYSSIDIDIDIPADYINSMHYIRDTSQVLIMGVSNEENKLYLTDMDFSGFNEISLNFSRPANSQSYLRTTVSPDGYIYALLTLIDYGDFKLPDYDDPDFDYSSFDFDAMYEAAEYSCILYKLSPDGQIIAENELSNISDYSSDSIYDGIYISDIVADANGNILMAMSSDETIYLIADENGRINGKISAGSEIQYINSFTTDTEGNIFGCGYTTTGSGIFSVDMNSKTFKTIELENMDDYNMNGLNYIYSGAGDYNFFFSTRTGLFGVGDDNNPVEIVNWIDSDINVDTVNGIIALDDGDFVAYISDYSSNTSGFVRLTKRNAEELASQTVITVGVMYSDSAITSKITDFNKNNTEYRVKIADYSKYNVYDEEAEKMTNSAPKQLKMDIISGDAPDMIITYDYSLIDELAPKGTFTDLSTYLKEDPDLSEDDIMPNIIKASKIKGKLYSLAPSFSVQTMACKSKFFDEENWTFEDMVEVLSENKDMQVTNYGNSKETVFSIFDGQISNYIDYDKAECSFNSGDFKEFIEFCNKYPDESEEINWETATQDEMEAYWNEQDTMFMEEKALLYSMYLYDMKEYKTTKDVYFGGDDITLVGYPSEDGNGASISMDNNMAILESSPSKEACWEFIKEFFTEDYQYGENSYVYSLPTLVSAFEKKAEDSMQKPYYLDENGEKVEYDNIYYVNNNPIEIKPLTEDEKDYIVDYIKNTDTLSTSGATEEINEIIWTEVQKYFNGEATSQQTCDTLQNRISILLSEQS